MEIHIGPYIVSRRTEYSKLQLFDAKTGKNITERSSDVLDKIMKDYEAQTKEPEIFFEIEDHILIGHKPLFEEEIEYAFLPDDVYFIDDLALSNSNFRYIHLSDSLEGIYDFAFQNCSLLSEISIPDSVKILGNAAFRDCNNLDYIKLSSKIGFIGFETFSGCYNLDNVILPDSIKYISDQAFFDCHNLCNIKLPKNLTTLYDGVFMNCSGLEKINLPENLNKIGTRCFSNCALLKEVKMSDNVFSIGHTAFSGCVLLKEINLSNGLKTIPMALFSDCTSLENIDLPDSIKLIEKTSFHHTDKIKNITLPKSLERLGAGIFLSCGVESLTINHDVEKIEIEGTQQLVKMGANIKYINLGITNSKNIHKLIIDKNVNVITPDLFGTTGNMITKIDYLGTEEEFKAFKAKNKKLFKKCLTKVKEINFIEKTLSAKELAR